MRRFKVLIFPIGYWGGEVIAKRKKVRNMISIGVTK
jgi:hypothetical protein